MRSQPLAVVSSGLVTSVGLTAPAACAAIRAKLTNPTETRFVDDRGEWIKSHSVPLDAPLRGRAKLAKMAAMATEESLTAIPLQETQSVPLLLCVAESGRPGRTPGLEQNLLSEIITLLDHRKFSEQSRIVPHGRVGGAVALLLAQKLVYEHGAPAVVIVGVDSMLTWSTLKGLLNIERLLTDRNSNGFIPGEAAAAIVVARPANAPSLQIVGIGFATETATTEKTVPLRADGLSRAISSALASSGLEMHQMDLRITDMSGEQYYFKEAALAVSRILRQRMERFDIWHPAECVGEVGSAIGPMLIAVADAACRKGYAPGPSILVHAANDQGERAAVVARFTVH